MQTKYEVISFLRFPRSWVAGHCTRGVKIRLPSQTGRILAKRAPLGAPSPSATPATLHGTCAL